jgi:hypothetical protein
MAEGPIPYDRSLAAPASYGAGSFYAVTPSDTLPLPPKCIGLYIGVGGILVARGVMDSAPITFAAVVPGFISGRFAYVNTGTTATGVVAFCIP